MQTLMFQVHTSNSTVMYNYLPVQHMKCVKKLFSRTVSFSALCMTCMCHSYLAGGLIQRIFYTPLTIFSDY